MSRSQVILPFLKDQYGFNEDVIKTQTVAAHRIHVERAIGKVRRFRIMVANTKIYTFMTFFDKMAMFILNRGASVLPTCENTSNTG